MKKILMEEIEREGNIRNPLSCIDLEDGTYKVTVGNQRLEALNDTNIKIAPCIISTKNKHKSLTYEELIKLFPSGIKRINLNHNSFQIVPADVDEYDPNKRG
jgi:hypothetical protein